MATYTEKLKDPRWQRKRLEVLQRDNFMCGECCDTTKTLHVHHRYYITGKEPWEYTDDCYITLCENCHEDFHEKRPIAEKELLIVLKQCGYHYVDIRLLSQVLLNIQMEGFLELIRKYLTEEEITRHTDPSLQQLTGLKH